jgi:hypothetical protein
MEVNNFSWNFARQSFGHFMIMKMNTGTVDIMITTATRNCAHPGYSSGDNQALAPGYLSLNASYKMVVYKYRQNLTF